MGAVYEGHDRSLDRRVAIKTLTNEIVSDEDIRCRFEREACAAAKLQHPNVITIYELGNFGSEEIPYIVMEYLEGTDLSEIISWECGVPFTAALKIASQLCRGLDFAHVHEVVHRDVKPSNVRYLDDGQVKIMDFGIARVVGAAQLTQSDVVVGTPHYMSPERILGESIDGRSDIFSVGCILYEMLTGERPFQADSSTGILYKIVHEPPPEILGEYPDLPDEAQEILSRALAGKPGDRFPTAGEMAKELEALMKIYRRRFARPDGALQSRIQEVEILCSKRRWAELIPLAEKIVRDRPDLDRPWHSLCEAIREQRREEAERQLTSDGNARHLSEVAQEIECLWPAAKMKVELDAPGSAEGPFAGDLNIERVTDGLSDELSDRAPVRFSAVAAVALALATVAVLAGVFLLAGLFLPAGVFLTDLWGTKPIRQAIRISSDPPGSTVWINGEDQAIVTDDQGPVELWIEGLPGEIFDIELRKEGHESALTTVTVGADAASLLDISLMPILRKVEIRTEPPGAGVSLDGEKIEGRTPLELELFPLEEHEIVVSKAGYARRHLTIPPGGDPPGTITLSEEAEPVETLEELGTLLVRSTYPLSILQGRRSLAAMSPYHSLGLTVGLHEITLRAPGVFLNRTYKVTIGKDDSFSLVAPDLGRASVRAFPENAVLSIDGLPARDLPINDMPIVAGSHVFLFQWPKAVQDRQTVIVKTGERVYVTGLLEQREKLFVLSPFQKSVELQEVTLRIVAHEDTDTDAALFEDLFSAKLEGLLVLQVGEPVVHVFGEK